jgi:hypothetical protein
MIQRVPWGAKEGSAGARIAASAAWAAGALALGAVLRGWGLGDQVLGGDELHAVRAALAQPLGALLTTYQLADSCIPLTALDRLLLDHGVALDETWLRLPVLACGLVALAAVPLLARRWLTPAAQALLWLLVALSPLLVLYSRIARSYMPATLFAFAAVMVFAHAWIDPAGPDREGEAVGAGGVPGVEPSRGAGGGAPAAAPGAGRALGAGLAAGGVRWRWLGAGGVHRRWLAAGAYAGLGSLAVWFHLGTAPLVAAPLVFAAGDLVTAVAGRRRSWRWLVAAGAALAAGCALFLVPAAGSLARLVGAKHQAAQTIPAAVWGAVLRLQAGCRPWAPAAIFWLAAVWGAVALVRRWGRFGVYLLVVAGAQLLGILVLSPLGLARAQVLDRYLLPVLPIVLVWVAAGLACAWWPRQGAFGRRGQRAAALGLVGVWAVAGPFADPGFRASSFVHHNDLVAFVLPRAAVPAGALPPPYRALGGPPGTAVVELPWPPVWDFGRSFYAYQEIHGLRVLVATAEGALPPAGRLRLRNRVDATPAALLASGARYVMVHRRLGGEEAALALPPGPPAPRRLPAPTAGALAAAGDAAAARLTAAWGAPDLADAASGVAAWDLARIRRGTANRRPRSGRAPAALRAAPGRAGGAGGARGARGARGAGGGGLSSRAGDLF